jgi:hypothetical protein
MLFAMTTSQKRARLGTQPASPRSGDLHREGREGESSPENPVSGTIRRSPPVPVEVHITHALNIAVVQLQNVEEMMEERMMTDPGHSAAGQLDMLQAILLRFRQRRRPERSPGVLNDGALERHRALQRR